MNKKVAIVTGSNKGIGYAIVKGLCKSFDGVVYLTARNVDLGKAACEKMLTEIGEAEGKKLCFHQLDITDRGSIGLMKNHLLDQYGGLDILVNNAGIAFKHDDETPHGVQAEVTIATNYYGTKAVCDELFPIMRHPGRVVNVASQSGLLRCVKNAELKERLQSPTLTVEELDGIVNNYISAAKEGSREKQGFPTNSYCMSKVAEIALTRIQQRMLDSKGHSDIIVNACCPGYVDTDMTSHKGTRTIDEGAKTPLYLALESADRLPRGKMIYDCCEVNWETGRTETSV